MATILKITARKNLENISAYIAGKPIEEVQRE
jgi:hypothetical protein